MYLKCYFTLLLKVFKNIPNYSSYRLTSESTPVNGKFNNEDLRTCFELIISLMVIYHSIFRPFKCVLCDHCCADSANMCKHMRQKHGKNIILLKNFNEFKVSLLFTTGVTKTEAIKRKSMQSLRK